MTDLRQRIEAALRQHYHAPWVDGQGLVCGCGVSVERHTDHIADAILAALQPDIDTIALTYDEPGEREDLS